MDQFEGVHFHQLSQLEERRSVHPKTNIISEKATINFRQFLGLLLGLTHYVVAGITSGYASVLLAQVNNPGGGGINISKEEASWIASIVVVPMAPSSLLCGFLLTKMRKKTLLILITLVEILAWLLIYGSSTVNGILIGRALCGIPTSMGSPIVPPYLAEISHPNMRGLYLSMVLLGISLGMLIIHVLGAFFTWHTCALITALILLAYFCVVVYLPETYAWYLRNDDKKRAERAFYWYRGMTPSSTEELTKLLSEQHANASSNYTTIEMLRLCCGKLLLMPLAITVVGMITMHLSGSKAIMFYSISIFSQVIPSLNQYTSSIIVDAIRILMTLLGCVLINKYPVRPLFIISGVGCVVSHVCFFVFFSHTDAGAGDNTQLFPTLALSALIGYTVFSSIGLAPLAWVIAGEIFPLIVKGVASGICCCVYFLTFFIVVKVTPELFDCFGIAGGFLFFGGCTLLGTIIMYFILPETKNKTLKEIENLFR